MDETGPLVDVERALEVEDGVAVLDRDHAPGRERPPVADAVDLVQDRRGRVSGAQEVRVQGVDATRVHGPAGGDERLRRHLAAEDALAGLVEVLAAEDVHLDGLEIEQFDELPERLGHGSDDRLHPWPRL